MANKAKDFFVWVPLLTQARGDQLILNLVRKGHSVGPAASSGKLFAADSTLLAIRLRPHAEMTAAEANILVLDVLKDLRASYHGVIVMEVGSACSWQGGSYADPPEPGRSALDRLIEGDHDA